MTTIKAGELESGYTIQTDLCIVGAGAAGITLASELAGQGFDICLMEAGGARYKRSSQQLYAGFNTGLPSHELTLSRFRVLGGSTIRWTGQCAPLNEDDFETHAWLPWSGWPLQLSDLEPFYRRANDLLGLGAYEFYSDPAAAPPRQWLELDHPALATKGFQFCRRTDFRELHRSAVEPAANIRTFLEANAVEIQLEDDGMSVRRIRFLIDGGKSFFVRAKKFVIAAGGIENVRLMLASDRQQQAGVGNQNDMVGRFFMDHPFLFTGTAAFGNPALEGNIFAVEGYDKLDESDWKVVSFQFDRDYLEQNQLTNCAVSFIRRPVAKTTPYYNSPAVRSLNALREALSTQIYTGPWWSHHLRRVGAGISDVIASQANRLSTLISQDTALVMRATLEHSPNPDSRICLSGKRDRLGMPMAEVDWRIGQRERHSLQHFHEVLSAALSKSGIAELNLQLENDETGWPSSMTGGKHHMGGTRMHADAKQGVVDAHCRVHDLSNLYIAGSSVFPTGGYANPTMTIIALSIRLADHLSQEIRASN